MASDSASVNMLKDAIIAEIASDVLQIKDDVQLIGPLVTQLKEAFPASFDALKAGLIETLDEINEGIKEAGGERIDFVKGQLHVFIEQAINKAFSENSDKAEKMLSQFEAQNKAAAAALRAQFDDVSEGMSQIRKEIGNNRFPTWAKVIIPAALILAIVCSSVISWQLASYKEALYMQAFMKQLEAEKAQPSKQGVSK